MRGRSAITNASENSELDSFLTSLEGTKAGQQVLTVWREWVSACSCETSNPDTSKCAVHRLLRLYDIAIALFKVDALTAGDSHAYQRELRAAREDVFHRHFPDSPLDRRIKARPRGKEVFPTESGDTCALLGSVEPAPHYLIIVQLSQPLIPVLNEVLLQSNGDLATGEVYGPYRDKWG
jgi:hypothetical protein